MEWANSGISQAIQAAKAKNAIFVVFVKGDDAESDTSNVVKVLDDSEVASRLSPEKVVAIKLTVGTEPCNQFSQIYPVVLVPSLYFIDSASGVDLEITGGGRMNKESILSSIEKAFERKSAKEVVPGGGPQHPVSADDVASPRATRIEQARQNLRDAAGSSGPSTSSAPVAATEDAGSQSEKLSMEDRVARARMLLASRKTQRNDEEMEKEGKQETERRQHGKTMQEYKRDREEQEMIRAAEERKKDREADKLSMEKLRAQIAEDRAEKAARFNETFLQEMESRKEKERQAALKKSAEMEKLAAERSTVARVQFRLPDGRSYTNSFPAESPLSCLYDFVRDEVPTPFLTFSLFTTFPKRQLDEEDPSSNLKDLLLAPSGTVLVLPKASAALLPTFFGGSGIWDYVWLLLTPITILWGLITSIFGSGGGRSEVNEDKNAHKRAAHQRDPQQGSHSSYRREGNISTLRRSDDDDDETNTYNGNSTQQM